MQPTLDYPIEDPQTLQKEVARHVEQWRDAEGNLIMILHAIQNQYGYVPRGVAMELARELNISLARIYEVITFYHYFRLVPPGRHNVAICTGTACYLKSGPNLLDAVEKELGIKPGQTTDDRAFHFETVRCIGCCGLSPAMVVDDHTYGRLKSDEVAEILQQVRQQDQPEANPS